MDALGAAFLRWRRRLRRRDQRGLSTILVSLLGFLLVLGAVVLFNFAIIGYIRHRAVTAVDAGALAGAEEIARWLCRSTGRCMKPNFEACVPASMPPAAFVGLYAQNEVYPTIWSQMGGNYANFYINQNGSRMTQYRVTPGFERFWVAGYPLPQILVHAGAQRDLELVGPLVGGRRQTMNSQATAEVYVAQWRLDSWPCSEDPPMTYYSLSVVWRIRLVR